MHRRTMEGLSPKTMGNSAMPILPKETDFLCLIVLAAVAIVGLMWWADKVKQLLRRDSAGEEQPLAIFHFLFVFEEFCGFVFRVSWGLL
jgi:hypothetical protein